MSYKQRLKYRQKKLLRKNMYKQFLKNSVIATLSTFIALSSLYIGFDYVSYKMEQEAKIKMENQEKWRSWR